MIIFPFFLGSIVFLLITKNRLKKSDNGFEKKVDEFLEREIKSNDVRKDFKDLNLTYIHPNKNLPFKEYPQENIYKSVIKKQNLVKRKIELEMIKLEENIDNTTLKELYGINNFDKITILEEHYNSYARGLYEWAFELHKLNNLIDCENVLLEAIRIEANISNVYILLAEIYKQTYKKQKLLELKTLVENSNISLKQKAITEINNFINSL